eukprot:5039831-Amphidinium_carterae.1
MPLKAVRPINDSQLPLLSTIVTTCRNNLSLFPKFIANLRCTPFLTIITNSVVCGKFYFGSSSGSNAASLTGGLCSWSADQKDSNVIAGWADAITRS